LLDQPVTSAGRHPSSDIFLDDITVSRHRAEFRWDNGEILVVDIGSLTGHRCQPGVGGFGQLVNALNDRIGVYQEQGWDVSREVTDHTHRPI
jgi:pSer/pThr/pTyr-binding forkhead associated (FHA) protein